MDNIKAGELYTINYLKAKGLADAPSFINLFNLVPVDIDADLVPNSLDGDTSQVYLVVKKSLSFSGDAIVATNYRDDYIVRGNSFANEAVRVINEAKTEYFVLDMSACDCSQVFKLPINLNPSTGTVIVNLYEGTDYEAGTTEVLSLVNRNRLSSNTASTVLALNDTIGSNKGTPLLSTLFGTDSKPQSAGGGPNSSANALLLDPTKKYLFEVIYSEACTIGYNMEIIEV